MSTYTFSSLTRFLECPRRYQYEYEWLIKPKPRYDKPNALVVGSAVHSGVAALHLGADLANAQLAAGAVYAQEQPAMDAMTPDQVQAWGDGAAIVAACVEGYPWAGVYGQAVAVERVIEMPVPGMPDATYAGRIDALVNVNGGLCVQDTKTTGRELVAFVKQQRLSPQYKGYVELARYAGYDVTGVILDAIGKPRITKKYGVGKATYHQEPLLERDSDEFWGWVRWVVGQVEGQAQQELFHQSTGSCYMFGLCPFYELCRAGGDKQVAETFANKLGRHEELR